MKEGEIMADPITQPFSRRRFAHLFGAGLAGAALAPLAPGTPEAGASPLLRLVRAAAADAGGVVRLSSNENPHGPSPAALEAMRQAFGLAWRYPDEHMDALAGALAKLHGVDRGQILLGNGSSEILRLAALAFAAPGRPVVAADPTFEAILHHAEADGAEAIKVPLASGYRHDLPKMLAAAPDPGLLYVCNPNNPTGTVTPKDELQAFLGQVPAKTMVLVDEAYHHYAESADYASVIPLLGAHPNLVVARTFSKVYGMAGLRCGYAVANAEAIERLQKRASFDNVNIMALAAAQASLGDTAHVERGRRDNREVKAMVYAGLEKLGLHPIPSDTNFFMVDLGRDVGPLIAAMKERRVEVGRRFAAMPNCMRVTVGTRAQMQSFLGAFREVVA
jgi:histidinol-phosphate aminotransferase